MTPRLWKPFLALCLLLTGCGQPPPAADPRLAARGSHEVTARLVEIPEGAILKRDLYDYAAILKYEIVEVRRGSLSVGDTIYVGHYNPWKPRPEAADAKVPDIGGNLREFHAGALHRMALEASMDDHYMGGVVDKYFGKHEGPAFWALWTHTGK